MEGVGGHRLIRAFLPNACFIPFHLLVPRLVHRNVPLRLVKATRDLMGILSKTRYRKQAKAALRAANGFTARKECLEQIEFRFALHGFDFLYFGCLLACLLEL